MPRQSRDLPIEPPPTPWVFPPLDQADESGVIGVGADLEPGTLLHAYRHGIFPMHLRRNQLGWWSPEQRGVFLHGGLRVSRSLRKSMRRFDLRVNTAFRDVVLSCADPRRPHAWINKDIVKAYTNLHKLGWAHSVEAWLDGRLVGGLYGVAIGGLFAGESMFHHETDASKAALVHLIGLLDDHPDTLVDCQWLTPHLASLGAVAIDRERYVQLLERALQRPLPAGLFDLEVADGAR
ncbi:MAG: leucyl/phenylalanyl-tRNA--protein transferase [Acidimicrobiia bacterium]